MHFEFLVEDASGSILLGELLPKILGPDGAPHTRRVHPYKGIGRVPKGLKPGSDADKRILLDQLPRLLQGYGRSLHGQDAAVVVIVDQDRRACLELKQEMTNILDACAPRPNTLLRIAIEEMEAWLLGDQAAIMKAYPRAKQSVMDKYSQDSVCGTWELLADALYQGGSRKLKAEGYPKIGQVKCEWAGRIGKALDIEANRSKSFQVFRDGLRRLSGR